MNDEVLQVWESIGFKNNMHKKSENLQWLYFKPFFKLQISFKLWGVVKCLLQTTNHFQRLGNLEVLWRASVLRSSAQNLWRLRVENLCSNPASTAKVDLCYCGQITYHLWTSVLLSLRFLLSLIFCDIISTHSERVILVFLKKWFPCLVDKHR